MPDTITIFPPEKCTGDSTDEDSGDENSVMLNNLPGSQLRVEAIIAGNDTSDDDDEEDDVALAQLSKRPRMDNPIPSVSTLNVSSSSSQVTATRVPKNKAYTWRSRDIRPVDRCWNNMQGAQFKQPPNLLLSRSPMKTWEVWIDLIRTSACIALQFVEKNGTFP